MSNLGGDPYLVTRYGDCSVLMVQRADNRPVQLSPEKARSIWSAAYRRSDELCVAQDTSWAAFIFKRPVGAPPPSVPIQGPEDGSVILELGHAQRASDLVQQLVDHRLKVHEARAMFWQKAEGVRVAVVRIVLASAGAWPSPVVIHLAKDHAYVTYWGGGKPLVDHLPHTLPHRLATLMQASYVNADAEPIDLPE